MHRPVLMVYLLLAGALACAPRTGSDPASPALLPSVQVRTDGERVRFALQVTNTTPEPVRLEFASGQSHDFVVLDGEREVWRWSADQMFTQALRTVAVAPGETLAYEAEWVPEPSLSGEYTIVGKLTARNRPVEQRARFRID